MTKTMMPLRERRCGRQRSG
uniref:Uncharacterized protein n=1 Tax=Arundo donax TaxID=35708 RepID=A0A0A9A133_ARUDO